MYSASEAINRFGDVDAPRPWELNGGIGLGYSQSFSIARRTFLASIGGHQHWTVDAVLSNARAVEHLIDLPAVAKSRLNVRVRPGRSPREFLSATVRSGSILPVRRTEKLPSTVARRANGR